MILRSKTSQRFETSFIPFRTSIDLSDDDGPDQVLVSEENQGEARCQGLP